MSLIRRCDICGHEFDEHLGVKPYWIKFSAAKLNSESAAKRYDMCKSCMCSLRSILDSINEGEFKVDEDFYTDITIVGRVLDKILEAENL